MSNSFLPKPFKRTSDKPDFDPDLVREAAARAKGAAPMFSEEELAHGEAIRSRNLVVRGDQAPEVDVDTTHANDAEEQGADADTDTARSDKTADDIPAVPISECVRLTAEVPPYVLEQLKFLALKNKTTVRNLLLRGVNSLPGVKVNPADLKVKDGRKATRKRQTTTRSKSAR